MFPMLVNNMHMPILNAQTYHLEDFQDCLYLSFEDAEIAFDKCYAAVNIAIYYFTVQCNA